MQSDLMGAHMLGHSQYSLSHGDYPTVGDHKDAKPVYDLDSVQVMQLVQGLNRARTMAGNKLDGSTAFTIGAAVTPEADPLGPMLAKFEVKVKPARNFFRPRQFISPEQFGTFMKAVRPFKVKVLAGILLLRSAKMAEFMNANIPGVSVPPEMIDEMRAAGRQARARCRASRSPCERSKPYVRTVMGAYHGHQGDSSVAGNSHKAELRG